MFRSERTTEFKFEVREGKTRAEPSVFKSNKGLVLDGAVHPPASARRPFKNPPKTPGNALK
jgi:hypothetical protein